MFCKNCGKELDNNAVVCTECGVATDNLNVQPAQPVQPAAPPVTIINTNTNTNANTNVNADVGIARRPKNKTVALILCLLGFLGFGGLHQFYVGKIGMGILYFFTYGLFFIGTIVDLIRILTGGFTDKHGLPLA